MWYYKLRNCKIILILRLTILKCLNLNIPKIGLNSQKKPLNRLIKRLLRSGEYRIRTDDPLPARQVL
jgi:hypothetical protein